MKLDIFEISEKITGKEVELNQFSFNFIPDFIPTKAIFTGISIKEGFFGTINGNFLIEGYIKGFEEFPVKTFRRKKLFDKGENVFNIFELKEPLEKIFDEGEDIDLEEKGIIDSDKNVIFLNKIEIVPNELIREINSLDSEQKVEKFISLTEKIIEKKIEAKILKFLEDSKSKPEIVIPDEIRSFVSTTGMLIEPKTPIKHRLKEKPVVDIKIKGISKIPSINSIIKKEQEGKKLNFIENLINEKLTNYLTKDINIWIEKKYLNKTLLKISFQRELVRNALEKEDILSLSLKRKLKIDGKEFDTKITITKNEPSLDKNKDIKIKGPNISS